MGISFYKETEFQESDIGEFSKDWNITKIGSVFKTKSGSTPLRNNINYFKDGSFHWVKTLDLNNSYIETTEEKITELALKETSCELLPKDSLLIAMYGGFNQIGRTGILKINAATNQAITALFPNEKVNMPFLNQFLIAFRNEWKKVAGSTRKDPNITKKDIENFLITIPKTLEEQQKIAQVLTTIDESIEIVDKELEKWERIKKATMKKLFSEGSGHTEFQETDIGTFPKSWDIKKVNDLFKVKTGTTPPTKEKKFWENATINWLTPEDLSSLEGKKLVYNSRRKISLEALNKNNLNLLKPDSIIISSRAPVGYVAVIQIESTFNQGCKGLEPLPIQNISSFFYAHYLGYKKQELENVSGGSTFKELPKSALENFQIPFPPISEQQKIAQILTAIDDTIEIKKKKKEKLERIKNKVMKLLLTGQVRIVLDI